MQSSAKSVREYLEQLPDERSVQIAQVREVILQNLPEGIVECMNGGMISYEVPLEVYPDTYNKKPLMYVALASQKNHMALYITAIYCDEKLKAKFEQQYKTTGKKMDIGKSCVRFKKLEDLPLEVIGDTVKSMSMSDFISKHKN